MTEVTLIDPVIALPRAQNAAAGGERRRSEAAGRWLRAREPQGALPRQASHRERHADPAGFRRRAGQAHRGAQSRRLAAVARRAACLRWQRLGRRQGDAGGRLDRRARPVARRQGRCPSRSNADVPAYLGGRTTLNGIATYKGGNFRAQPVHARAGDKSLAGSASYKKQPAHAPSADAECGRQQSVGLGGRRSLGRRSRHQRRVLGTSVQPRCVARSSKARRLPRPAMPGRGRRGGAMRKSISPPLKSVTAKLKLSAGQLTYNGIKIAQANLQATISGGKLAASLPSFKLYDGAGTLNLDCRCQRQGRGADGFACRWPISTPIPSSRTRRDLRASKAQARITLDLATSGASQRAMVSGLNGTAKFDFTDGAIRGINIAKTMRSLSTGVLSGWQENAAEKTDFATLGASFKVAKGQAETSDLRLAGPLVRMAGAGRVDLPAQTLKFRVDPQLVASLEGQGGKRPEGARRAGRHLGPLGEPVDLSRYRGHSDRSGGGLRAAQPAWRRLGGAARRGGRFGDRRPDQGRQSCPRFASARRDQRHRPAARRQVAGG